MALKKNIKRNVAMVEGLESRRLMSNTWWVAEGGSDNGAGDSNSPFASIQHAVDVASEGDKILLRSGTYQGGIRIDTANLTIRSAPDQASMPCIVSPNDNPGVEVTIRIGEQADSTKLAFLDISGGYNYTIKTESMWDTGAPIEYAPDHVRIQNSKLHDSGADVIKLTPGTDYSRIVNNEIYNSGRTGPDNAEGVDAVQANFAVFRGNYVHDTTTNGVYYKGGSRETLIENNVVARTGHSGILVGQHTDENWFDLGVNPNYYESIDAIVRNNIVVDTQGAGIGSWAALRPQIYNNTLENVAQTMFGGLLVQGQELYIPDLTMIPSTDVTIYNNIVNVYSDRPVLEVREAGLTGSLNLSNNLYYQGGNAPRVTSYVHAYDGNLHGWKAMGFDGSSFQGNPMLDVANMFTLSPGSPAINAGVNYGLGDDFDFSDRPIIGTDIGAHEFA